MSPGLFQELIVFVAGVTEGNEDAGLAQYFILLFSCKSGELGSRESPRFLCITSVVRSFSSDSVCAVISY